jgi:predicted nuclease of predicted toxin-antitoxin system
MTKLDTDFDDSSMAVGKVVWTRLYNIDNDRLDKIALLTHRKKSQLIRMFIHEAIDKGIIAEFAITQ